MTNISAKLIKASRFVGGPTLYSVQTKMPKWMLAELNTHRAFSRSSGSSRAIPIKTMIEQIRKDPFIPVHWGVKQAGMQAEQEHTPEMIKEFTEGWLSHLEATIRVVESYDNKKLHKQVANRLLEPWMMIDTIITATDWDNFFTLRCHKDAQPEMQVLANAIKKVIDEAVPDVLTKGEWHLPYISEDEKLNYPTTILLQMSTARCARVSYHKHDGTDPTPEEDIELFNRLVIAEPLHASPAEHQATPISPEGPMGQFRNLNQWAQFRAYLEADWPY